MTPVADVSLRPCAADDADALAAMYAVDRDELVAQERRPAAFFTAEGQRRRITQLWPNVGTLGWVVLRNDAIVGLFVLEDIRADSALVGYFVASAVRNQGLATRALAVMIETAFDEFDIRMLIADILPHNL